MERQRLPDRLAQCVSNGPEFPLASAPAMVDLRLNSAEDIPVNPCVILLTLLQDLLLHPDYGAQLPP